MSAGLKAHYSCIFSFIKSNLECTITVLPPQFSTQKLSFFLYTFKKNYFQKRYQLKLFYHRVLKGSILIKSDSCGSSIFSSHLLLILHTNQNLCGLNDRSKLDKQCCSGNSRYFDELSSFFHPWVTPTFQLDKSVYKDYVNLFYRVQFASLFESLIT